MSGPSGGISRRITCERMPLSEKGLTLVELMVAVVLAGVLSAGLYYMMHGQSVTYRSQLNELTAQQNLWGAAEYLQRQVRIAGYQVSGSCPGNVARAGTSNGTEIFRALTIYNACNIHQQDPRPTGANCCSNANTAACLNQTATDAPDSFSVTAHRQTFEADPTVLRLTQTMAAGATTSMVGSAADFALNDLILLREPGTNQRCIVRHLSAAPLQIGSEFRLTHDDAVGGAGSGLPVNISYAEGTFVTNLGTNTLSRHFAINSNRDPPELVTWVTNNTNPSAEFSQLETVAAGVEDMQISYACDPDGDGLFNEGSSTGVKQIDEWVSNVKQESQLPDWPAGNACSTNRIGVVRITLVGRGASLDIANKKGFRPQVEDRDASSPDQDTPEPGVEGGTYRRTKITLRIMPRNVR